MRYVHGLHVYDDQSDQWYKFDTEDDSIAFASEGEHMQYNPTVRDAVATHYDALTYVLNNGDKPLQLLGPDTSRTRVIMLFNNSAVTTDVAVIGPRASVMAGSGFVVTDNYEMKSETTDEVWCGWSTVFPPSASSQMVISVWVESGAE